jgi:hypothetical protein
MSSWEKAKMKIRQAWEENPVVVAGVGAAVVTAAAKLLDSVTAARNSRSWKKEVDRRTMNTRYRK